MNIAELLMNIQNEYSGHKQTIIKGVTVEQGMEICQELEEYVDKQYSFVLEIWTDGCFTIYQKDYFPEGKQGGRDRIILSTDG
jgi:hypothetical protein